MYIVLSIAFSIFYAIYGVVCIQLTHSSSCEREHVFVTHLLSSSTFPIVGILRGYVSEMVFISMLSQLLDIHPGTAEILYLLPQCSLSFVETLGYIMTWPLFPHYTDCLR